MTITVNPWKRIKRWWRLAITGEATFAALNEIAKRTGTIDDLCPVCGGDGKHTGWCWYELMMDAIAKAEGRTE
jgi:hypothetical protein